MDEPSADVDRVDSWKSLHSLELKSDDQSAAQADSGSSSRPASRPQTSKMSRDAKADAELQASSSTQPASIEIKQSEPSPLSEPAVVPAMNFLQVAVSNVSFEQQCISFIRMQLNSENGLESAPFCTGSSVSCGVRAHHIACR